MLEFNSVAIILANTKYKLKITQFRLRLKLLALNEAVYCMILTLENYQITNKINFSTVNNAYTV